MYTKDTYAYIKTKQTNKRSVDNSGNPSESERKGTTFPVFSLPHHLSQKSNTSDLCNSSPCHTQKVQHVPVYPLTNPKSGGQSQFMLSQACQGMGISTMPLPSSGKI